ncbi:hypothetical protein ACFDWR_004984 [Salmonella enterica]|uniref:hypothetical protein n=1 Tax=Salmonella enterica TaxID=28901 RepID=UPI0021173959|nr:hypothetical protein [Salmonella enterica]
MFSLLYRLTPGFGGFTPVPYEATKCRLTCADAHKSPFLSGTKTHAKRESYAESPDFSGR